MNEPDLRSCRILLVDDTKTNIDVLVEALGGEYRLGVALSGQKALEYVEKNQPDLILLDVLMPEMDGFEVCRRLQSDSRTREIPIIFITAADSPADKNQGFDRGAVDYIVKPFDISEVKARVKTHLALRMTRQALQEQNNLLEQKVLSRTRELQETQSEILERLSRATEYRDVETGNHIKRIQQYCQLLGEEAGLSAQQAHLLSHASTMHDVGKIGIPDTILLKKGGLTPEEEAVMKGHPEIGAQMLAGSNCALLQAAETIARTHHEKWDGTGYPQGLKGEEIPLYGRIVGICDVFDALISKRPYKEPWSVSEALAEIRAGAGSHFDPQLVRIFLSLEPQLRQIITEFS